MAMHSNCRQAGEKNHGASYLGVQSSTPCNPLGQSGPSEECAIQCILFQ